MRDCVITKSLSLTLRKTRGLHASCPKSFKGFGAKTFLDEADIEYGDDFEERILQAVRASQELLVLLTPWALRRPYIWLEIGAIWGLGRRVVGVLHGLSPSELVTQEGTPALLSRVDLVRLNDVNSYLDQLRGRVENWGPTV